MKLIWLLPRPYNKWVFSYVSKILPLFFYPLGLAALLLAVVVAADLWGGRRTWRTGLTAAALLLLWLGGNHGVAHGLIGGLERKFAVVEAPQAEVIVVLGGATRPPFPPRPLPEVSEEGDRLIYAAELYRMGAAPRILVSGGRIGWLRGGGPEETEAADMTALLTRLGVPETAIWQEPLAENTYENALYSRALLAEKGIDRVILVTSAFHMPRAVAVFEKQGFEVIPAPTDFFTAGSAVDVTTAPDQLAARIYYFLPQSEQLEITTIALKEYLGRVIYRLRGWI